MARKEGAAVDAMRLRPKLGLLFCCGVLIVWMCVPARTAPRPVQNPSAAQEPPGQAKSETISPTYALPRGKKLILKDGSFQLVRTYQRNGERVRYYSMERAAWEELPAAMVDWDATAKAEVEQNRRDAELAKKAHVEEEARKIEVVMDVDASLQVAPGVFLPPGEGMFVVEGRTVSAMEQVGTEIHTDKKQFLKQVLVPIPIVPSKHNLEIPGTKARLRISTPQPEFYLREAPPDPDRVSPVRKSSRPGESGPEVELVRATVKGNKRRVESIRSFFGQELKTQRKSISIQRWDIAPTVFRFTLSQPLEPGEYVLAEILPDGMNLYVWDFGVDAAPGRTTAPAPAKKPGSTQNPEN